MERFIKNILGKIARISRYAAIVSAGSASHWGGHQPEEPDMKQWKK